MSFSTFIRDSDYLCVRIKRTATVKVQLNHSCLLIPCLHDTTGRQTGCTTGLTTGCIA